MVDVMPMTGRFRECRHALNHTGRRLRNLRQFRHQVDAPAVSEMAVIVSLRRTCCDRVGKFHLRGDIKCLGFSLP